MEIRAASLIKGPADPIAPQPITTIAGRCRSEEAL
jgi:hypothetical protein